MTLLPLILVHLTMLGADYTAGKELKHYVEHLSFINVTPVTLGLQSN